MKVRSIAAAVVGVGAALWHYRSISIAAAHVPAGPFPWIPAIITTTAVLLSLYWWGKAKEEDE